MNKTAFFLGGLLAVILLGLGAQAFEGELTNQPVRSSNFWRSNYYHDDSWVVETATQPEPVVPVVTATTINQCRQWDLYELPYTVYSHGSSPIHLMTLTSGWAQGCILFLTEETAEARAAACQTTCATSGGCSATDCELATTQDAFWVTAEPLN